MYVEKKTTIGLRGSSMVERLPSTYEPLDSTLASRTKHTKPNKIKARASHIKDNRKI